MSYWKQRAEEAKQAGYQPGNAWEKQLAKHLQDLFPEKFKELKGDLEAYLQVMTASAMQRAADLEDQGTSPEVARELAMQELLQPPPEEEDQPEPWELEGAEAALEDAAQRHLSQNP